MHFEGLGEECYRQCPKFYVEILTPGWYYLEAGTLGAK